MIETNIQDHLLRIMTNSLAIFAETSSRKLLISPKKGAITMMTKEACLNVMLMEKMKPQEFLNWYHKITGDYPEGSRILQRIAPIIRKEREGLNHKKVGRNINRRITS